MGEPLVPHERQESLRPRSRCLLRLQQVPDGPHGAGCRLGHSPPPVVGQQSEPHSSHPRGRSDPPQRQAPWSSTDHPLSRDDPTGSLAECGQSSTRAGGG